MFEALSLGLNPVDITAVGLMGLMAMWLGSMAFTWSQARRPRPTLTVPMRAPRRMRGRPAAAARAEVTAERPTVSPTGPAMMTGKQQLMTLIREIETGIDRTRHAEDLERRATLKLDALESEFLSLCDEIATVSSFARQRVERPNLAALAGAAANLGFGSGERTGNQRPVGPRIDRDPSRARRRQRPISTAA